MSLETSCHWMHIFHVTEKSCDVRVNKLATVFLGIFLFMLFSFYVMCYEKKSINKKLSWLFSSESRIMVHVRNWKDWMKLARWVTAIVSGTWTFCFLNTMKKVHRKLWKIEINRNGGKCNANLRVHVPDWPMAPSIIHLRWRLKSANQRNAWSLKWEIVRF